MAQSTPVTETIAADVATKARATIDDIGATGTTIAAQAEAVADQARAALSEMRAIVDRFAVATGEKAGVAADAVKATGTETVERFGALVSEARDAGAEGLETLSDSIAKRPLAALAVAAGVGLLIGMVTRPGAER